MDRGTIESRIAALRTECSSLARTIAADGRALRPEEAFELAGAAQGLANSADGLVAVLGAWGARVETVLTAQGPVERVHGVGFVDAMAATEMALAIGSTEGVAGRKAALGAALGERFPQVRDLVLSGAVTTGSAQKVVDACAGLDADACARVDARVAPRLSTCDPARLTALARRAAADVAADQVAAQAERTRRGRTVELCAGPDGLTSWWAALPTATSAAAWSAVDQLAGEYRSIDPSLTVDQARADAFGDLLLRNVSVSAHVTLGIPVVAGRAPVARSFGRPSRERCDLADTDLVCDPDTGELVEAVTLSPHDREALSWVEVPAEDDPCGGAGALPDPRYTVEAVVGGHTVSGTELPGLGWVDAATVANLLATVPLHVGRAVLDAATGTLASVSADAYRPSNAVADLVRARDGTCRMWGCGRPATGADLDHTRPWPGGPTGPANLVALCRRHHRMKQSGRWRPVLDPDGTLTWTSTTGRVRTTEPAHRVEGCRAAADDVAHLLTPV